MIWEVGLDDFVRSESLFSNQVKSYLYNLSATDIGTQQAKDHQDNSVLTQNKIELQRLQSL